MTNPITVEVRSEYLHAQSQPEQHKYAFGYHITITNQGEETATLISRHWVITDGNGSKKEVRGAGVVGEQPTLLPGKSFSYSSFAVIDTSVGTMEGSYQMRTASNQLFDAPIAPFLLAVPGTVN